MLINVGTLEKRKNQAGLVDLFAEISQDWPKAKLVLVGDGPQRGEVRRRIEERKALFKGPSCSGTRRDVAGVAGGGGYCTFTIPRWKTLPGHGSLIEAGATASLPVVAVPAAAAFPELLEAARRFRASDSDKPPPLR